MTPTERQRARELCEAATPGPWEYNGYRGIFAFDLPDGFEYVDDPEERWVQIGGVDDAAPFAGPGDIARHPMTVANAEFIAAARTLVPRLLDALEEAEADIAQLRARPDRYGAALEEIAWPVDGRDTMGSLARRARVALGVPVGTGRGVPIAEFHRQILAREQDAQIAEDRADYFASQGEG